jgi:hypothetical protein
MLPSSRVDITCGLEAFTFAGPNRTEVLRTFVYLQRSPRGAIILAIGSEVPVSEGVFRADLFCQEEDINLREQLLTTYMRHGISLVARDFHFPLVRKAFYVRPTVHIFNHLSIDAILDGKAKAVLGRAALSAGASTVEFDD